jgi:predicted enzyme related to lactoylglutathione lyase
MTTRFFHLQLRTHDTEDARSFYAQVLGDGARDIVPLHPQAVARGARPHWLGYLEVEDVDDAASAFLKRGAIALGSKSLNDHGLEAAVVREPGGAVLALAKPHVRPSEPARARAVGSSEAIWYQLNTVDVDRAKEDYKSLFGWSFADPIDAGEHSLFHPFAWDRGGAPIGWMTDIVGRAGRHAHWLFHFPVAALEPAIAAVRSNGGYVMGPFALPHDGRIAVCDDPQSAAFAVRAA